MAITFIEIAIQLAKQGMQSGAGGPFGAVIVKDNQLIGQGYNCVLKNNDPTAHAEIVAIRHATSQLKNYMLQGCEMYCVCEPCPMCLGAILWARIDKVYYVANRDDAAAIGFDDATFYQLFQYKQNQRIIALDTANRKQVLELFDQWQRKTDKRMY